MDSIMERLTPLFRDVLNSPRLVITPSSSADTIEGYDSLAHINIISAIEQEFGLRFELKDILALSCVGDMVALIRVKQQVAA